MGKGDKVVAEHWKVEKEAFLCYGNQFGKVSYTNSSVASGSVFFLNSTTSGASVSHAKVLNIDSSAPLKQG